MRIGSTSGKVNGEPSLDALEIPPGTTVTVQRGNVAYQGQPGDYLAVVPISDLGPAMMVPIPKLMFERDLWEVKP